jgi:hypothetical protein
MNQEGWVKTSSGALTGSRRWGGGRPMGSLMRQIPPRPFLFPWVLIHNWDAQARAGADCQGTISFSTTHPHRARCRNCTEHLPGRKCLTKGAVKCSKRCSTVSHRDVESIMFIVRMSVEPLRLTSPCCSSYRIIARSQTQPAVAQPRSLVATTMPVTCFALLGALMAHLRN